LQLTLHMLRIRLSHFETPLLLTDIHVVFEEISERNATRHLLRPKATHVYDFSTTETEI
jgi:hypothetical protein